MKMQHAFAALTLGCLSLGATAAMSPDVENKLIAVCKTGLSDSQVQFHSTMKEHRINETRVFPRLVCNGETFYDFAVSNGSNRTAERIARYLPGKVTIKDLAMNHADEMLYVEFDK